MERALKYTVVTLLAIVLLVVVFVYGLYFAGARQIPADWKPTTATYPVQARLALWRSLGGSGEPRAEPLSPIGLAWRIFRAISEDRIDVPPGMRLASRTALIARLSASESQGNSHLMGAAATIRASQWPAEEQLDTVLDNAWFGEGVRGFRQGALHVFGRELEQLDAAQLHVLMTVEQGPGYFKCRPDRLRESALAAATRWNVPVAPQKLEAALATIGPPPSGHRCAGQPK